MKPLLIMRQEQQNLAVPVGSLAVGRFELALSYRIMSTIRSLAKPFKVTLPHSLLYLVPSH